MSEYLIGLARAYLASPAYSEEEDLLERAYRQACDRMGVNPDDLLADSRLRVRIQTEDEQTEDEMRIDEARAEAARQPSQYPGEGPGKGPRPTGGSQDAPGDER